MAATKKRVSIILVTLFVLLGLAISLRPASAAEVSQSKTLTINTSCTTNSTGFCTIPHTAGVVPDMVIVQPKTLMSTAVNTVTVTNFQVQFGSGVQSNGAVSPLANKLVTFRALVVYTPSTASPSPTVTSASASPTPSRTSLSPSPIPSVTSPSPVPSVSSPPVAGSNLADAYKRWTNGPNPTGDKNYFPIGVWLQNPARDRDGKTSAERYKSIGIDFDDNISSWPGCGWCANEEQALINSQWNAFLSGSDEGVRRVTTTPALSPRVKGYLMDDEADMAHWDPNNKAVYPTNYKAEGDRIRALDPTRPNHSNFGKGMAIRGWIGYQYWQPGGAGTYEGDMKLYCDSSDIVSVDYYGYTDPYEPANYHGAWTYGKAIDNIHYYCGVDKIAYGFVEASHPYSVSENATNSTISPAQMEAAAWNMIVHGANGLIYFAHHFTNNGLIAEDGLFERPEIVSKAKEVNTAIKSIAPVLNTASTTGKVSVTSTNNVPVSFMHKVTDGKNYIVAGADGNETLINSGATTATFTVPVTDGTATVVGENRTVPITNGKIVDNFVAYGHHVYMF
jgi:hypothetical protein